MDLVQISAVLGAMGCPKDKCGEMASQLDKRARQLAQERNQPYEEALKHLLQLMQQGWAAQQGR